tara:strand:+ start:5439 stop:6068 length:630 start_codon:yes stop_codon:yes gene_type:complete
MNEESHYTVENVHEYGLNVATRDIFLFPWIYLKAGCPEYYEESGVENTLSSRLIYNLKILESISDEPITIHMKTCGGDWHEGMAIYDAIKLSPCHITSIVYTHARSMSSIILQAADWRVMMPNSVYMFHDGDYGDEGTVKTVRSNFDFYDKIGVAMLDIYVDSLKEKGIFSSWGRKKIKNMLVEEMDKKENVYLTAKEAVSWGFADEVL